MVIWASPPAAVRVTSPVDSLVVASPTNEPSIPGTSSRALSVMPAVGQDTSTSRRPIVPSESAVFFRETSRTVMATAIFLACAI
ncbi:Uncharacterised protein [Mycobacteroides abscessus]|nr:Uncharacterised protein [Mycobacteroides abscessus]